MSSQHLFTAALLTTLLFQATVTCSKPDHAIVTSIIEAPSTKLTRGPLSMGKPFVGIACTNASHASDSSTKDDPAYLTRNITSSTLPTPPVTLSDMQSPPKPPTSDATANASVPSHIECTGCGLEALNPTTFSYDASSHPKTTWVSVIQTLTLVTQYLEYLDGYTSTVITVQGNRTMDMVVSTPAHQRSVHTTPVFTWVPAKGTILTFEAGPTYVAYTSIFAGLDRGRPFPVQPNATNSPAWRHRTCGALVSQRDWLPKKAADWEYYIQTFSTSAPSRAPSEPITLANSLVDYLSQRSDVSSWAQGHDIHTCTLSPTFSPGHAGIASSHEPSVPELQPGKEPLALPPNLPPMNKPSIAEIPPGTHGPGLNPTTSTYISSTYTTTWTHISIAGCLRCSTRGEAHSVLDDTVPTGSSVATRKHALTRLEKPEIAQSPQSYQLEHVQSTDLPGIILSLIDRVQLPDETAIRPNPYHDQSITRRNTLGSVPIRVQPAQTEHRLQKSEINRSLSYDRYLGTVITSQTVAPGQSDAINRILAYAPTGVQNHNILVESGTTIAQATSTAEAELQTVGDQAISADLHAMVVSQYLSPGGPTITEDGAILGLKPKATPAIVIGAFHTLENVVQTGTAPILTVIQHNTALIKSGMARFDAMESIVRGHEIITRDGTTIKMPKTGGGGNVIFSARPSTFRHAASMAAPALTVDGKRYTATAWNEAIEYDSEHGSIPKSKEAIAISGTTYSIDLSGDGHIINAKTSTVPATTPPINSAITTKAAGDADTTGERFATTDARTSSHFRGKCKNLE